MFAEQGQQAQGTAVIECRPKMLTFPLKKDESKTEREQIKNVYLKLLNATLSFDRLREKSRCYSSFSFKHCWWDTKDRRDSGNKKNCKYCIVRCASELLLHFKWLLGFPHTTFSARPLCRQSPSILQCHSRYARRTAPYRSYVAEIRRPRGIILKVTILANHLLSPPPDRCDVTVSICFFLLSSF